MIRYILAAAILSLAQPALAAPRVVDQGPATLVSSHQFVVHSEKSGHAYRIQVSEPVVPIKPGQKAPVIYMLDGNYSYGMATDISRNLPQMLEMELAYVVGVGFDVPDQLGWDLGRERDYIHTPADLNEDGKPEGGGGAAFEAFVVEELKPIIEGRFPVDPARSYLAGNSLGGLFAANMMLNRPKAFAGYVIGSPSVFVDPTLLDRAKAAAAAGAGGGRKVYVGVEDITGGLVPDDFVQKHIASGLELAQILSAPGSGFVVESRRYKGETHITFAGSSFANAMRFLLPAPPRPPKPKG